jgi:hypothetical protein
MSSSTSTPSQSKQSQYVKEVKFISKKTRSGRRKLTPCPIPTSRTLQSSSSIISHTSPPLTTLSSDSPSSNPLIHKIKDDISMPPLKKRRKHVWTVCFLSINLVYYNNHFLDL